MSRPARLFAYGTLQVPAIFEALSGLTRRPRPAVLPGFVRRRVRGAVYPAVVECGGALTPGGLYEGVDASTLAVLDAFEGDRYERRSLEVRPESGSPLHAWVYVLAARDRDRLGDELWDLGAFARDHTERYVAECRQLRRRLERA